ncbi:acid phosphatase family membrane protein YuiD [Bacillus mesophilus]|uniref:Divergent PAP2 family protein n=1 Tax=Bacillus mesophilus TaxID=1808955 RepID=A0A6M0QC76_9BACI|nr:divergent PAP2 family protein [Bacillus mesophilus]MBM7663257.1 acid phosphatase family membrane protein YuiD [Bacillus mesophilus]NEY73905.1 divergent PAP2 family protein [Bacillus mesophilus]
MNKGMVTAITTIGLAQFLKIPLKKIKTGKWEWETFVETGGMPSSHSAGVTSLATFIALKKGVPTVDFALASVFGMIVMYDAQGIRRQTGELTLLVNDMEEDLERLKGQEDHHFHDKKDRKLKEMLGHQPAEVLGGALLGMLTGTIGHFLTKKK